MLTEGLASEFCKLYDPKNSGSSDLANQLGYHVTYMETLVLLQ